MLTVYQGSIPRENVEGSGHFRTRMRKMKSLEREQAPGLTNLSPQRSLKWKAHFTMIPKLGRRASLPKVPAGTEKCLGQLPPLGYGTLAPAGHWEGLKVPTAGMGVH